MSLPGVGFVLGSNFHPAELITVARAIEDNGFDSVWSTEDYFMTGGVAGAAVVLGATERLTVGTGVLSAYARHPALVAMEAATLASAYPGRFRLGLGSGGLGWLDQQGIAHRRPLSAVRGSVRAIRALLAGEELSGEYGGFAFDGVRLAFTPEPLPPVYVGATGPKMTALAGQVADGLLLSVFTSPEFVRRQAELVNETTSISTFAFFALDAGADKARDRARPVLAAHLADGESTVMTDAIGITEELRELARGGAEALAKEMPDSWVDQLAVCGNLDTCLARIYDLGAAGTAEVALAPIAAASLPDDIARLGTALRAG